MWLNDTAVTASFRLDGAWRGEWGAFVRFRSFWPFFDVDPTHPFPLRCPSPPSSLSVVDTVQPSQPPRSKPWGELSQVSAEDGLKVLSNLSKINLSHVENLPGYLIGVMKNLGLVGKLEINKPWHQRGHGGKGGKGGGKGRTGRRGSEMLRMAVKNHTMMVNNNNVMNYNNNAVMYLMEEAERGGRGGQGASHRYPHYPPPVSHQQQYPHYPPLVPLMDPMSHQRQFGGYPSPPTSPYMYGAGQQSVPVYMPYSS